MLRSVAEARGLPWAQSVKPTKEQRMEPLGDLVFKPIEDRLAALEARLKFLEEREAARSTPVEQGAAAFVSDAVATFMPGMAKKPWEAAGMSKATYYRAKKAGTLPNA